MVKRQTAVVLVDNNKLLFYTKNIKSSLQLDFPSDTVSDLEVINLEKFEQLVNTFFQTDELKGVEFDVILVFSKEVTFEKDFTNDTTKAKYEEIQEFLDMVPFEEVLRNAYEINKKTKVVAVNETLYKAIRDALEKNKAYISLVVPLAVLTEVNAELANNLDLALIASRVDSFKEYSLIEENEGSFQASKKKSINIKKKDRRLYALLGVFALLAVVLIFLIFTTFFSSPKSSKKTSVLPKVTVTPIAKENKNPLEIKPENTSTPSSVLNSTQSSQINSL